MSTEQLLLNSGKEVPYGKKSQFIAEELTRILADGPQPQRVIKEYFISQGFKQATVYLAFTKLNLISKSAGKGSNHQTIWSLPPEREIEIIEREVIKEVMVQPTKEERRQIRMKNSKKKVPKTAKLSTAEVELIKAKQALYEFGQALSAFATTRLG